MTREEELIGEVIAARGLAQMLAIMLVKDGIVPREKLEGYVVALAKMWKSRADQTNPAIDLAAAR